MITAVTGTPGAGKSYRLVCGIAEQLLSGGFVATNVALVDGWEERLAKRKLARRFSSGAVARAEKSLRARFIFSEDAHELLRVVPGCRKCGRAVDAKAPAFCLSGHRLGEARGLWVLDEAHERLNSRTWSDAERLMLVKWLSRSRHRGWDVELGTQAFDSLDKQLRDRVEYEEIIRNLRRAQFFGVPLAPFDLFLSLRMWVGGPKSKKHRAKTRLYLRDGRSKLYDTRGLRDLQADELNGGSPIFLPRAALLRPEAVGAAAGKRAG